MLGIGCNAMVLSVMWWSSFHHAMSEGLCDKCSVEKMDFSLSVTSGN